MRLLIVDDDDLALDALESVLVKDGHDVIRAMSGDEAMNMLSQTHCRLVISDWLMPGTDGLELCRKIRQARFDTYVYVILLTSRSAVTDVVTGLSAGADDFLAKPFNPEELRARVRVGERILALETRTGVAESANRAKSEFLANMSHEVRTPMTAVLGYLEILEDPEAQNWEREEAIAVIRRNGNLLLKLINEILDLSRIEAGREPCSTVDYSPREVLTEAIAALNSTATHSGLQLTADVQEAVASLYRGDPVRLRQILMNLIGNAIKFTESGSVRVRLTPQADQPTPRLVFDIVDTGIGMSAEECLHAFDAFWQADASLTRKRGGTGLGLTISRRFAGLLGGTVEIVRSDPGGGTHIRLSIEAEVVVAPPAGVNPSTPPKIAAQAVPPVDLSTYRILLAEDAPDNQWIIKSILSKAGAEVVVVDDGALALEAAFTGSPQRPPFDLILMDMQMPVMDGYAATRELRRRGYGGRIVALTAHSLTTDRQRCLDVGCDDYVTKPIVSRNLIALVKESCEASRQQVWTPEPSILLDTAERCAPRKTVGIANE